MMNFLVVSLSEMYLVCRVVVTSARATILKRTRYVTACARSAFDSSW